MINPAAHISQISVLFVDYTSFNDMEGYRKRISFFHFISVLSLFFTLHLLSSSFSFFCHFLFFLLFPSIFGRYFGIKFTISVDASVPREGYNRWTFPIPTRWYPVRKRGAGAVGRWNNVIVYEEDRAEHLLRPLSIQPLQTNTWK